MQFCRTQDPSDGPSPRFNSKAKQQSCPRLRGKGYPVSLNKKSRARLATYRQWAERYFEKPQARTKRKGFMKIFLSNAAKYDRGSARFDSSFRFRPLC